jgi:arginase family enzyme
VVTMKFHAIGAPLDPDERETFIARKIDSCISGYSGIAYRDPLRGMLKALPELEREMCEIDIEPWILPTPPEEMLFMLTVENFVTFIDSDGCLEYANKVKDAVRSSLPDVPLLVGVDHSLSGGAIKALAEEHGGENMRLIVFDSHFDYIPPSIRCGLIHYDMETNPGTKFAPGDPYVFNRSDSYNADSFLSFMKKIIPPENTYIVGVSDYPPREALESGDTRVKGYVDFYRSIQEEGVHLIRKDEVKGDGAKRLLSTTDKPYTYVSVDVDVCANASLRGARFLDYHGLQHTDLYGLVSCISSSLRKSKLAGLDFMEFDVYSAGATISGKRDRTYEIMAEVFCRLTRPQ